MSAGVRAQGPTVLDPSFNAGTGANDDVFALALQPDGKLLVGGQFTRMNGADRLCVARLNPDGSLDSTFDTTSGPNGAVYALALQSDGKVLIGGAFTAIGGQSLQYLSRLNSDGSVDPEFLTGTNINSELRAIALQPDGSLAIGGRFTSIAGQSRRRVARLFPDGTLDFNFDPGKGANDFVRTLDLQANGKVVLGGQFTSFNGVSMPFLARLETDGSLDLTCCDHPNAIVRSLAVQSDGAIRVGGEFSAIGGVASPFFARLLSGGKVDPAFSPGVVQGVAIRTITAYSEGTVLVGGQFSSIGGVPRNRLARLTSDGSVDATFDPGAGADNEVFGLAVQPDGRVVVGGQFTNLNQTGCSHVARILSDTSQPAVEFTRTTFSGPEDGPPVAVTIHRTGRADALLTVDFSTADGTATAGLDYLATSGTLTFQPGETVKSFPVSLLTDALLEGTESVSLILDNPVGGLLGWERLALLNIEDGTTYVEFNDFPGVEVHEGDPSVCVALRRVGAFRPFTVRAAPVSGTALAGIDFISVTNDFSFASNQVWAWACIPLLNDGLIEDRKQFTITLFDAVNVYLDGQSTVPVTLWDNDRGVSFAATNYVVGEQEPYAELFVARGNDGSNTISVHYATENGTAAAGLDFVATEGTLSFGAGESLKAIRVPLLRDCLADGAETFNVRLTQPSADTRVDEPSVATVTIFDLPAPGTSDRSFRPPAGLQPPMVVQPDGRILVGGGNGLLRLNADGTPDPGFVMADPLFPVTITAIGLQPDGKVLVAGWSPGDEGFLFEALRRLEPEGSPDPEFQGWYRLGVFEREIETIGLPTGGSILLGGDGSSFVPGKLSRLFPTGEVDPSFSATTNPNDNFDWTVLALAVDPNSRILIGGKFSGVNGTNRPALARLNPDGGLDLAFDAQLETNASVSVVLVTPAPAHRLPLFSVVGRGPQTNSLGPVGTAGTCHVEYAFGDPTGTLQIYYDGVLLHDTRLVSGSNSFDVTYGPGLATNLVIVADRGSQLADSVYSYHLLVQTPGVGTRIYIAGQFDQVNGRPRRNLARLNADGSLDESFDPGNFADSLTITALVSQPTGKLVVGGVDSRAPQPGAFGLARLDPDGTLDASLETNPCLAVAALALQPDTSILALGEDVCGGAGHTLIRIQGEPRVKFSLVSPQPDGSTRLVLDGNALTSMDLQASSDFRVWATLGRIDMAGCPVTFLDSSAGAPQRFYRLNTVPDR